MGGILLQIGLSCKAPGSSSRKGGSSPSSKMPALDLEAVSNGDTVDGIVAKIEDYGVFVDIGASGYGLLHRSQTKVGMRHGMRCWCTAARTAVH